MSSNPQRVQAVFLSAVEKPPNQCAEHLLRECSGDIELRQRVEALLQSHDEPESFLESPLAGLTPDQPDFDPMITEKPGTIIGPYKLLQQIGEGGFGVVFLAEQQQPVRRRVALKVIKPGMNTREVIARFEAERQALALMEHPNIAKVLDAGTTASGLPYFVMELVPGVAITEYCDQLNLPARERLDLFVAVCLAIQHAHQKGIIHRDIKSTNVLVAIHDGQPAPKIIDFGVAKAIDQRLTEQTLVTAFAQMVGTPLYMSPEQAELSPLGVDTRTDIYSLGVLLYELLTGVTPLDKDRLHSASYDELRRIMREEEPPWPSARLSTLQADLATTVADRRRTDPQKLRKLVRGELDWIVMKCLERDRSRRYPSASGLAEDVERYLHDEPVLARPASWVYRLSKFTRRNRALVTSMVLIVASLLVASIVSARFTIWAQQSELLAKTRLAEVLLERDQKEQAQQAIAQRLYVSQLSQAVTAWEAHDYGSLEHLLLSTSPTPKSTDLRGWEWYYLHEQFKKLFAETPQQPVQQAAWHPLLNQLAVVVPRGVEDSAIEVWVPGERRALRTVASFPGTPAMPITGLRWSAHGTRMAFATNEGRVVVLDATTGGTLFDQQAYEGTGHLRELHGFDLTPSGDLLATANFFGQIKTWDVPSNKLVDVLFDPEIKSLVRSVKFSPGGDQLAATLRFGRRAVWDLKTNAPPFHHKPLSDGAMGHLQWCADGSRFAATDTDIVAVYGRDTAEPVTWFSHRDVEDVCWINSNTLASAGTDQAIRVWDLDEKREVRSLLVHRAPVSLVAASHDGQFLASKGGKTLKIVRLAQELGYSHVLDPPERRSGAPNIVRWSRDGTQVAVAHQMRLGPQEFKSTVRVHDVKTSKTVALHKTGGHRMLTIDWSTDNRWLRAIDYGGHLHKLGVADGSFSDRVAGMDLNKDDSPLVVDIHLQAGLLTYSSGQVRVCDLETLEIKDLLETPLGWHPDIAWSPDGRRFAVAYGHTQGTFLLIYDVKNRRPVANRVIVDTWSPVLTWDSTSTLVAVGTLDGIIRVLDATSLEQRISLEGHQAVPQGIAWSPDGARIASCGNDGTVRIWEAVLGDQLAVFNLPDKPNVYSVDWSPDGRQLAAAADTGEVYVLDAGPSLPHAASPTQPPGRTTTTLELR